MNIFGYGNQAYINEAKSYLARLDEFGNKDGKVSVDEYQQYQERLYASIFANNQELLEKANELIPEEVEIVKKYADKDGIFNVFEYIRQLDSEEKGAILAKYRDLLTEMDAENKFGREYIEGANQTVAKLGHMYGNENGQATALSFMKEMNDTNTAVFANNADLFNQAQSLSLQMSSIIEKYAGRDGILTGAEMAEAINSDEYNMLMAQWHTLDTQIEAENKFGKQYVNEINQSMEEFAKEYGNENGQVTALSFFKSRQDLNKAIFRGHPELMKQAESLILQMSEIIEKYSQSDWNNIISGAEFALTINSPEYGALIDQWKVLADQTK